MIVGASETKSRFRAFLSPMLAVLTLAGLTLVSGPAGAQTRSYVPTHDLPSLLTPTLTSTHTPTATPTYTPTGTPPTNTPTKTPTNTPTITPTRTPTVPCCTDLTGSGTGSADCQHLYYQYHFTLNNNCLV